MKPQDVAVLRDQLATIILGTIFVVFGVAALLIAAIRDRREFRIFVWLGIWSGLYGANLLLRTTVIATSLPRLLQPGVPFTMNAIRYLLLVAGLLAWSELTLGKVCTFTRVMVIPSLTLAIAGIALFAITGSGEALVPYNNLLAGLASLVLTTVILVPKLSARFLARPSRVLGIGALGFASNALYRNISNALHPRSLPLPWVDELVFAGFLFSFAYVAERKVFANERRLLAIESELEIARKIQTSILPASIPQINGLQIAASYQPMAAIGGDFYDFIPVDENRIGLLVADVSGHGVPAALIASMIKIGVQSVFPCAADPAEVLRGLNRVLSGQLRGMLVSAAYLWIDREAGKAWYSAAGHPPLLCWHASGIQRVESNGLLFGVLEDPFYPVRDITLQPGDRFLLYTDGVVEPEDAAGVAFGDTRLEQVVCESRSSSPADLSSRLISEIRKWQPPSTTQQDDITLMVIDVV